MIHQEKKELGKSSMIYALGWLSRFPKKILIFVFIWGQPDSLLERKNTNGVGIMKFDDLSPGLTKCIR